MLINLNIVPQKGGKYIFCTNYYNSIYVVVPANRSFGILYKYVAVLFLSIYVHSYSQEVLMSVMAQRDIQQMSCYEVADWLKSAECSRNFDEDVLSAIEGC